jgi:hypothetical protein
LAGQGGLINNMHLAPGLEFVAVQHNIFKEPLCGVNWWQ